MAEGRGDRIGWLELRTECVNEIATQNTARVIREVNADILATIEGDASPSSASTRSHWRRVPGAPYPHVIVIDGTDVAGIDVG